jgi:hypothetical protein
VAHAFTLPHGHTVQLPPEYTYTLDGKQHDLRPASLKANICNFDQRSDTAFRGCDPKRHIDAMLHGFKSQQGCVDSEGRPCPPGFVLPLQDPAAPGSKGVQRWRSSSRGRSGAVDGAQGGPGSCADGSGNTGADNHLRCEEGALAAGARGGITGMPARLPGNSGSSDVLLFDDLPSEGLVDLEGVASVLFGEAEHTSGPGNTGEGARSSNEGSGASGLRSGGGCAIVAAHGACGGVGSAGGAAACGDGCSCGTTPTPAVA